MWIQSNVVFSVLNIPGSDNDLVPWTNVTPAQAAQEQPEFQNRLAADIAWLYQTFSTAAATGAKGVALLFQADM